MVPFFPHRWGMFEYPAWLHKPIIYGKLSHAFWTSLVFLMYNLHLLLLFKMLFHLPVLVCLLLRLIEGFLGVDPVIHFHKCFFFFFSVDDFLLHRLNSILDLLSKLSFQLVHCILLFLLDCHFILVCLKKLLRTNRVGTPVADLRKRVWDWFLSSRVLQVSLWERMHHWAGLLADLFLFLVNLLSGVGAHWFDMRMVGGD